LKSPVKMGYMLALVHPWEGPKDGRPFIHVHPVPVERATATPDPWTRPTSVFPSPLKSPMTMGKVSAFV